MIDDAVDQQRPLLHQAKHFVLPSFFDECSGTPGLDQWRARGQTALLTDC